MKKVVVVGGGVLGTQIGLIAAYWGNDVTFWLKVQLAELNQKSRDILPLCLRT